ncbi:MAG: hypothetical protein E6K96_04395 [Thaumarchaeota archaeon]|nr:MAG: hypothetical protein E6K96_04395 [Nitrososphaerota archaeon]
MIVGSFLIAFKAVLLEGSEVAILSVATVTQLGKKNVLAGVLIGSLVSIFTFLAVRQVFVLLPDLLIDFITSAVLLYFSSRFLRGFVRYYFGKKSFRDKMSKMENEVVAKELKNVPAGESLGAMPFSFLNALPVLTITLTEGFEASLVLAAAGTFNFEWTIIGALVSIALLISVSAVSYQYLLRVPRWLLDLIAGVVLLSFGLFFLGSGVLSLS